MKSIIKFDTVELSLNNFCTIKCQGCPSLNVDSDMIQNLDITKTIMLLDNIGFRRLVLCGSHGEPTLNPEINVLFEYLCTKNDDFDVHLSTNGETVFEFLKMESVVKLKDKITFQVSIDGHTQELHEITRGHSDLSNICKNLRLLLDNNIKCEVVSTRHELNEKYSQQINQFIKNEFGLVTHFRDTSHLTKKIRPPSHLSKNGNVSVLYQDKESAHVRDSKEYEPRRDYLYIDYNGDLYPCASFVKYKTAFSPPNLSNGTLMSLLKEYFEFRGKFCENYQCFGDKRQCLVNCGVYLSFKYDLFEDLNLGNK